jgi:aryl-alcohol dehydrogenase-like predicted oxidoreductase
MHGRRASLEEARFLVALVMIYRTLGNTGLSVSQVGLGTWPLAGNNGLAGYGAADEAQAEAAIHEALAAGITLFDTADVYGAGFAEELLGQILRNNDRVIVVTKGGMEPSSGQFDPDADKLARRAEASLKRLRREVLDIYLLHNPPPHLLALSSTYRAIEKLRKNGLVRWLGVSVARAENAWLVLDRPEVDIIQLPFSLINVTADLGLLTEAAIRGKAVLVREALANGLLSDKSLAGGIFASDDFRASMPAEIIEQVRSVALGWEPFRKSNESWVDFSLRFVLDRPEVSTVLVGARRPEHFPALKRAGAIVPGAEPRYGRSNGTHASSEFTSMYKGG